MTFRNRLQPQILLTSPSGIEFSAHWVGDQRSLEKTVAVFKTPGVSGVVAQDLGAQGVKYPLTFYFEGPDNDLTAAEFLKTAGEENGPWVVIHPVHGAKNLQLLQVAEAVEPVRSGNLTEFSTEWLEVILPAGTQTTQQLSAEISSEQIALNDLATDDFTGSVGLDTADQAAQLAGATGDTVSGFSATLESITSTVASVQAQALAIVRDIESTVFGPATDLLALGGQIQALVSLPQLIVTDLEAMIETYSNFADAILGNSPENPTQGNINRAAMQQLSLSTALGAVTVASTASPIISRQETVNGIERANEFFTKVIDGLEVIQDLYADELLSNAYFSQLQSFSSVARISALQTAFLLRSAFDAKIEKLVTLKRPENPVMLAMREYGGPGVDDANIDLFYNSNGLTGNDTILLPAGRKVRVYL